MPAREIPAISPLEISCPRPLAGHEQVLMAHGGGGRLAQTLLDTIFLPAFGNPALLEGHDGSLLPSWGARGILTTDAHVVSPLFFPGGDLGSLAVYGTVNDLAVSGARPQALSAAFILEEGLPLSVLQRIVQSMAAAARRCGISIVTGDTKVVERGRGDGVYIVTTGVGPLAVEPPPLPRRISPGDHILLSGDLARHGMAIMTTRAGIELETTLVSDSAPIHEPILALWEAGLPVHCLRDLTRGGLVSALAELAERSRCAFTLQEATIPILPDVQLACELLGFDPLQVANEGRFVCILPAECSEDALKCLRAHDVSQQATRIGTVEAGPAGRLTLRTLAGTGRLLDRLSGEQLPRIC